uniref:TSA: Wollemia nobilis Ref_Wollemi_Transcript_13505_1919 transcribed RNA sequence n=1 Tax=Wollemia nobilis TaxID=56998 RepID=A0A0C9QQX8_9CONI
MGANGASNNRSWNLKKFLCSWAFFWRLLLLISVVFYTPLLFWLTDFLQCRDSAIPRVAERISTASSSIIARTATYKDRIPRVTTYAGDLRKLESSWNALSFGRDYGRRRLKIAVFVKKWPEKDKAGGLERHARTLHCALAKRGHEVHVFTAIPRDPVEILRSDKSMHFHFTNYTDPVTMFVNRTEAWATFEAVERRLKFDIIHTESVCLQDKYAKGRDNVVVSWHGIAYEIIQSDIVQEFTRDPAEARSSSLRERVLKVVDEIKFFPHYKHHVATSDSVGDVLRTVYMLPPENIHIILNGVDEGLFRPNPARGRAFRATHGVPSDARLVFGMAGRLVKDKGHPLVLRVLRTLFHDKKNEDVYVLIAGDGPWAGRYAELGNNVKVLGPLASGDLMDFYNALDVFVNPTLRSQGMDHTLLEAMMCGKALMATHFSSITWSAVVSDEFGYTFSPTYESLKRAFERVSEDGRAVLEEKGVACRKRASMLFTSDKMASAFERLFLCIAQGSDKENVDFCKYPLATD